MTFNNTTDYKTTQYNVLSGDVNNLITNIAPSATSGVPLISQGASSQPIFGTAVVAGGGTGDTSFTPYAVICGGTTTTGNLQSIAGVGTASQVLTSNGAGTLPTFQSLSGTSGSLVFVAASSETNPLDARTYLINCAHAISAFYYLYTVTPAASVDASCRFIMPRSGTITKCYGVFRVGGTLASAGNSTLEFRLNNTSNTTITSTLALTSATNSFSNTGLSISVVAGDYLWIKWTTPTWATNPTNVTPSISFILT